MNSRPYVLDNAAPETPARFSALSDLYDATTIRHLERIGVDDAWSCWEIGAGPGSIAHWLAQRVGAKGSVLATDIDTRFLKSGHPAHLEVRRHDIVNDPVPARKFDVIHTRLVLVHLPERDKVIDRMISALKPGGWLLAEEYDALSAPAAPDRCPWESTLKSAAAFRETMMAGGVDSGFGRMLPGRLRERGLEEIHAEGRILMMQGGTTGAHMMKANYMQLREPLLASGKVTSAEFEQDLLRLDEPDYMAPMPIMWSVAGRRPAQATASASR